ncbi:MAG: phosphatidate cytidylyltransferase [Clostridia bacterium]|nr:phosphatidate cytidylyltransferase [Clostridia bacterium]
MKNERVKRTLSGLIIIAVTFPILFFTDTLVITGYMTFVASVGTFELLRCCNLNKWYIVIPAEIIVIVSHFICRLRLFGLKDLTADKLLVIYAFMAALFILYMFTLSVFIPGKFNIETNGFASLMFLYVLAGTLAPVMLSELPNGAFDFPLIFISAWMTDWFAYMIGSKLGKHKLCPTISPKKSIEGAVGGIIGNVVGFAIYAVVLAIFFPQIKPNYIPLFIAAIVLSVVSQLGDLFMSLVKRRFNIKDFGKMIPGHGGILDRFDSITAVSIVIFIFYSAFKFSRGF